MEQEDSVLRSRYEETGMIKDCKMRHENGNCLPAGGFCTANKNICEALQNAYNHGYFEGIQKGFEKGGEQKWIPVSEWLPKKDGRYQVTRHDYVTNTEFVDILWYEENLWWNRHSTGNYAVTAWMPLPKPYEDEC